MKTIILIELCILLLGCTEKPEHITEVYDEFAQVGGFTNIYGLYHEFILNSSVVDKPTDMELAWYAFGKMMCEPPYNYTVDITDDINNFTWHKVFRYPKDFLGDQCKDYKNRTYCLIKYNVTLL